MDWLTEDIRNNHTPRAMRSPRVRGGDGAMGGRDRYNGRLVYS